jgi:hypothetical protein
MNKIRRDRLLEKLAGLPRFLANIAKQALKVPRTAAGMPGGRFAHRTMAGNRPPPQLERELARRLPSSIRGRNWSRAPTDTYLSRTTRPPGGVRARVWEGPDSGVRDTRFGDSLARVGAAMRGYRQGPRSRHASLGRLGRHLYGRSLARLPKGPRTHREVVRNRWETLMASTAPDRINESTLARPTHIWGVGQNRIPARHDVEFSGYAPDIHRAFREINAYDWMSPRLPSPPTHGGKTHWKPFVSPPLEDRLRAYKSLREVAATPEEAFNNLSLARGL